MKSTHLPRILLAVASLLAFPCFAQDTAPVGTLKVHNIFSSNMVIQRGKPIKVWGWAKPGDTVSVQFGNEQAEAKVGPETHDGRQDQPFPSFRTDDWDLPVNMNKANGHWTVVSKMKERRTPRRDWNTASSRKPNGPWNFMSA